MARTTKVLLPLHHPRKEPKLPIRPWRLRDVLVRKQPGSFVSRSIRRWNKWLMA